MDRSPATAAVSTPSAGYWATKRSTPVCSPDRRAVAGSRGVTSVVGLVSIVVLVLGGFEPLRQQRLDGVGGAVDVEREVLAFGRSPLPQDVVGRVLASGRTSDAEAHPQIVLGAEGGGDGAEAVVPAVPAAPLQPQRAVRKIEFVMDDDD